MIQEKTAISILREAREKYADITFDVEQRAASGSLMVYAKCKGLEYNMGAYKDNMVLPCENFVKAVEHFTKKDEVFQRVKKIIENSPYGSPELNDVEEILFRFMSKEMDLKFMSSLYQDCRNTKFVVK